MHTSINNTNLNLYKTFVVVYETKNMNRASAILKTSREAVRKNIKELSNQIGTPLFVAHTRGVEPTAAAGDLYPEVLRALQIIADVESRVSPTAGAATLNISAHQWFLKTHLENYLPIFQSKYPKVSLNICGSDGANDLLTGKADLAFDWDTILACFPAIQTVKVLQSPIRDNIIASETLMQKFKLKSEITKTDLQTTPVIVRAGAGVAYEKLLAGHKNVIKVPTTENVLSMVQKNLGVGFYGEIGETGDGIIKLTPKDFTLPTAYMCAGYKTLSRAAKVFLNGIVEFCNHAR
jgi:DNA-binding transcriptional LysR family regulator